MSRSIPFIAFSAALVAAAAPSLQLKTYVDSFTLHSSFNPIKESYWTGLPHHRRTNFAVSPDCKTGYLAYLDSSGTGVHVQHLNPSDFTATGTTVTVAGVKEAGGLVAHNDGFALLGNEAITGDNAPPDSTPVPAIYRYSSGKQVWKTLVAGPGIHESDGLGASPDMNGDLAYSEQAGLYGAYFVVTYYTGEYAGHFADSIEYVNNDGKLNIIEGATMGSGCSHNTGIAFEAADEAPFASVCAEDQGAIWLNTGNTGMTTDGVKISNENTTNGGGGEAFGGMSGSYSGLARFINSTSYILTWVSRGAAELSTNDWLGEGYTHALNRTNGRRVAMAILKDKKTKAGKPASSEVGGAGDSQVNWVTHKEGPDRSNAHVAAFDDEYALISWEQIDSPQCYFIAMGCGGTFSGTFFQLVHISGKKIGEPIKRESVYVAGDMVTRSDGRICWPYVNMKWSLDAPSQDIPAWKRQESATTTKKMSFACMRLV